MSAPPPVGDVPIGQVATPDAVRLPDPARLFAARAQRLDALSEDHPMAEFLRFLARLSRAQDEARAVLPPASAPEPARVAQAVEARMPPLAADGLARDASWRTVLLALLDGIAADDLPTPTRDTIAALRAAAPAALEEMADDFLRGTVAPGRAAQTVFVAAALQVWFAHRVAALDPGALRILPQEGLCPCCGSPPVAGLVMADDRSPGSRYLHCGLCGASWNHIRVKCIACGSTKGIAYQEVEGGSGAAKAETCDECRSYSKIFYQKQDAMIVPFADDIATLGLDIMVAEAGWSRHEPNPLVLAG